MRKIIYALAFLLPSLVAAQETAKQQHQFDIVVDTASVGRVGTSNTFVTWVYAVARGYSLPSSGILVAFDCDGRKVKRLAQVKYQWNADSTGVEGPIEEVNGQWVEPTIPVLYELVCRIGSKVPLDEPTVQAPPAPKYVDPRVRIS